MAKARLSTTKIGSFFEVYETNNLTKADHDFLDNDVCKAFLRRIKVLNRHAVSITGKFEGSDDRIETFVKITETCSEQDWPGPICPVMTTLHFLADGEKIQARKNGVETTQFGCQSFI